MCPLLLFVACVCVQLFFTSLFLCVSYKNIYSFILLLFVLFYQQTKWQLNVCIILFAEKVTRVAKNMFPDFRGQKMKLVTQIIHGVCMKNKYFNSNKMKRVIYITSCPVCVCVCQRTVALLCFYVHEIFFYFIALFFLCTCVCPYKKSA